MPCTLVRKSDHFLLERRWCQFGPTFASQDLISEPETAPAGRIEGLNFLTARQSILRWYAVNQVTSFPVISNPEGIVFDGANIWVANGLVGVNAVTKGFL